MDKDIQQDVSHLKKDLVKIFVFFSVTVVLMVILYFLNEQTGLITNLASLFTRNLIQP